MDPRAEIGRERRRQIQVRKAFEAGLEQATTNAELVEFYLACGDYIVWSMERLHEQDQIIHDRLNERVDPSLTEVFDQLAELNERQAKSRAFTDDFGGAVKLLKQNRAVGQAEFETAARKFVELFTSLMAPRKNPFSTYTDQLFDDSDWADVAGVTDRSRAEEQELFGRVEATSPVGIEPANYTAVHAPG